MRIRIIGAVVAILLAIAGTFVLVNYVRTADIRASEGAEFVPAYIVKTEVPAGTPGESISEYIEVKDIPALAAIADRVTSLADIEGLITNASLQPGEQLLSSRWVDPRELGESGEVPLPDGMQAVTIALQVERVAGGAIQAGDTVGVVISAEAEDAATNKQVLLTTQTFHKVLVLSVQPGTAYLPNDNDDAAGSQDPVDVLMVTLARTTPDIEVLVWGQEWGKIWLTLEPEAADEEGGRTVDGNIIFR
jgi:pilus assembly protein CpaB